MTIYEIILMFIFYSIFGWSIEVVCSLITEKKFVNRGFLIGPYCPIYGFGGVLITLYLSKYSNNPITLFVMAVFICAVLEYMTSYLMEKLFNARWWDYSTKKFNINGRICLEILSLFGLLGCIGIYIINPIIYKILSFLSPTVTMILAVFVLLILVIDCCISFHIISTFKMASFQFKNKDNTEEITKKVKEKLYKMSPLTKRLVKAFPDVKAVIINFKNELIKTKNELKTVKKDLKKTKKKLKKIEKKK